jgi:benzoyl-CoA reductase/2-hydroxyglutaryl-CoA dehydratase subunit BcrC/BadD/HgdB
MDHLKVLDNLKAVDTVETRKNMALEAKANKRKIIGTLCSYIPEEIIWAGGMLPWRILGDPYRNLTLSSGYITTNSCSFCRNSLSLALQGEYSFLDGLVATNSCSNLSRTFDAWVHNRKPSFSLILDLPYKSNPEAQDNYRKELAHFKTSLENMNGREISGEDLTGAIKLYNKTRYLLQEIFSFQEGEYPRLTGTELLAIETAAFMMERNQYNTFLQSVLDELKSIHRILNGKIRFLLTGSISSHFEEVKLVEEMGGLVIMDDLCTGSRYTGAPFAENSDPFTALSQGYLTRLPCARMISARERASALVHLIQKYRIDAVIYSVIKFCDPYLYEFPTLETCLKRLEIPLLRLEREYHVADQSGQLKTRLEAFMEMLIPNK